MSDKDTRMTNDSATVDERLAGVEHWEARACHNRHKHIASWDICIKPQPDDRGVAVIASVYSGEAVAKAIVAACQRATASPSDVGDVVERVDYVVKMARQYEAAMIRVPDARAGAGDRLEQAKAELLATIRQLSADNAALQAKVDESRDAMRLLASIWFYGGWKAETHNERLLQERMESAGFWPVENEATLSNLKAGGE